jgi:hypothetical protein
MNFDDIRDLSHNPMLKALLINYVLTNYEENAITDDYHLMMEYNLLRRTNQLHQLFTAEMLNNYFAQLAEV